ncbi:MAG: SDR family NAD(P)-dependent oxidoreductase [Chitinophagaceae bacterium]|nr:SDR family NAD(P)-dependent oxidoreductase [Chitinophagaceae bacterium]
MSKIALITGASSGIGYATAKAFASNGIDLILCGRNRQQLKTITQELGTLVKVTTLFFDVRNNEEVTQNISSLSAEWKEIDILVNCAGNAHGLSSIENGDITDWDMMIDANVKGLLYVSRVIMPLMVERKRGHIVNISSVAGKYTYQNGAVYCASKKAVEAISEGMRLDLTQHGIKVTNIAPGAVETNFSVVRFKGDEERAKKVYEGFEPIKPEDVADAIFYAVNAPKNVTIADMVLYAGTQAAPTIIYRDN